jgi:hypothetical protein
MIVIVTGEERRVFPVTIVERESRDDSAMEYPEEKSMLLPPVRVSW